MANNSNLGNEWKDTAYNLGGAFVDLGKTLMHSIKTGVDVAYDFFNEEDKKKAERAKKRNASASSEKAEKVETIIIEE